VDLLIHDFLANSAARRPDKTALICEGQRVTYGQIEAASNRLANALVARGLKRGDRVAVYLPNNLEAVVSIYATLKAGGVFVMINPATKKEKFLYILNDCRATALIMEAQNAVHTPSAVILAEAPSLQFCVLCRQAGTGAGEENDSCFVFEKLPDDQPAVPPLLRNIDLDLACLIYTSGTTGEPKAVMCDHSNMVFVASSVMEYLKNVESDVILNVLPLSFSYGLYQVLMTFWFGGTLVLEDSFAYPAVILERMQQERVTGLPGVPTMYAAMLKMDLSAFDLSSLRFLTNAAAALPVAHILEIRRRFPRVEFYSMYGQTECKRTLYLPPDQLDERPGSVGLAIPGTEVWIEDESGNKVGSGEVGELVVRGRHVMRGYWEDPQRTSERFRPGPIPGERIYHSGDLFRMDDEGYLYFVSRQDDIIKSRGEKVAPKEVEHVLHTLKGVVEAAVVGVPDPVLGEAIKAVLVLDGVKLTQAEVQAHCRAHLEDYMVPKHVEFRTELPKTGSGKIKRNALV